MAITLDVSGSLATPPALRDDVACKDLALREGDFDVRSRFPAELPAHELYLAEEAPLSESPGGPPVGRVRSDAEITVVGQRGGAVQIVVRAPEYLLGGWVPRKAFAQGVGGFGLSGVGEGGVRRAGYRLPNSETPSCARDIPLFAEARGRRAEVGVLMAETPIVRSAAAPARTDGFVAIELMGKQWLELVPGAEVLVRRADLERCRP